MLTQMIIPSNQDSKVVAERYGRRWNFLYSLRSIKGKQTVMHTPVNLGSLFYKYKGTFSMVLNGN